MRWGGAKGLLMLILFLFVGAILGGVLGEILSSVSLAGIMPFLVKQYVLLDIENIRLSLFILDFHFGIRFAPNLLSVLGILLAAWLYRRVL